MESPTINLKYQKMLNNLRGKITINYLAKY